MTGIASEIDEAMAQVLPLLRRECCCDFLFDPDGIALCRTPVAAPVQAFSHADNMRIDREPGKVKSIAEHDICGFAAYPRQRRKLFHGVRYFTVETLNKLVCDDDCPLRFGVVEADSPYDLFDILDGGVCKAFRCGVAAEKFRRYFIDLYVGSLCAHHSGDKELEWVAEDQRRGGVFID